MNNSKIVSVFDCIFLFMSAGLKIKMMIGYSEIKNETKPKKYWLQIHTEKLYRCAEVYGKLHTNSQFLCS